MEFHNGKVWIFTMLLFATSAAAFGQSAEGVGALGVMTGVPKALGESASLPPTDNLGKDVNSLWTGAELSPRLPSGDSRQFDLSAMGQPFSDIVGAFNKRGTQEMLPTFTRESSSSGVPDGTTAAPAGDKTKLKSSDDSTWTTSRIGYWALQGVMFATVAIAVQETHRCLAAGSCTAIPTPFQSRPAMFSVGVPVAVGVSILSYEMKKHGNRWWFLPPAIVSGAATALIIHSVQASQ